MPDVVTTLEATVAEQGPRIVATLIRLCGGDFQLAEDALQDAVIVALERWPAEGVPARPDAWLITAARRRAIDLLRRDQSFARKREQLEYMVAEEQREMAQGRGGTVDIFEDDRLRLIFTCCHPALTVEAQVALTLRVVAGLDTPAIASAFLVPVETMAKRLTRARAKIRDAGIPYRVPAEADLPARLEGVLTVVYLVFNAGYLPAEGEALTAGDLCDEAIRLGRLLQALMPDESEVLALLALILLVDSRRSARVDDAGDLILLEDQDRRIWDRDKIEEGTRLLEKSLRMWSSGGSRRSGSALQVQAAIAALHAEPEQAADTDWPQVAYLYDRLQRMQPDLIVALNRAAAVGMAFGPEAGLHLMDAIEADDLLPHYHALPAARADLLRRAGRLGEAAEAYQRAIALCANAAEIRYLRRRLAEVTKKA